MSPIRITCSAIIFKVLMITGLVEAQGANPQETLNPYVADLQKNPSDYALREKIIKHVQTMNPAPPVPEEELTFSILDIKATAYAKDPASVPTVSFV